MSIWDDLLWRDEELVAADLETSGRQKEYALQPWRMARGDMWITSASIIRFDAQQGLIVHLSQLFPRREQLKQMLEDVIANGWTILGWNLAFDISCLMALGPDIADLCMRAKWLDGMLMWRHLDIEPEYEFQTRKDKKKSYSLKGYTDDSGTFRPGAVQEFIPTFAGLDEDVDFHATDPASLAKLQRYNDRDNVRAWTIMKLIWAKLAPRQRRAVLIQAECLPVVAQGNLLGLVVDRLTVRHLAAKLDLDAAARLFELAPDGMTEEIVRSPAKLGALMFNPMNPTPEELAQGITPGWQLPVLKENKSRVEGKPNTRSTDKEVLHELSFVDPRAAKIKAYREALNARGKFCESVIESLDYNGDGRTHPVARLFGTYCVPGDVEVMTRSGWVALQDWDGGEIAQVHTNQLIEFLPAERFVGPVTDEWLKIDHQRLECAFTPGHTMPFLQEKTRNWATTKAGEMVQSRQYDLPIAGVAKLDGQLAPLQMRMLAATQADGYFNQRGGLSFCFEKSRKIDRMRALLLELGLPFREQGGYAARPDRAEFHIHRRALPDWLTVERKQFGAWVLDTTTAGLTAFVDELVHWDGSDHADGGSRYISKTRSNVEWAVTAAALIGRKASLHEPYADGMHGCHISGERPVVSVRPSRHMTAQTGTQRAFCATTQTGFWLARSKGHIFVTGNTDRMTVASKQGRNSAAVQIGFALHQMKREKMFREIITVEDDCDIVEFDAAGQEFRWMAIASNDATMLTLCQPGEDAHSYMGAEIMGIPYRKLMADFHAELKAAQDNRYLGKFANLCIAEGTQILTDRGPCSIEDIQDDDLVWDGEEFVAHAGLSFSGVRDVITHQGVTATPEHKVLVNGRWVQIQEAARHGWSIEPSLGSGWTGKSRAAARIMDGIVRRTFREKWSTLCESAVRLRDGARRQLGVPGDRSIHALQGVRDTCSTPTGRGADHRNTGRSTTAETRQRMVPAVSQPEGSIVSQLRRTWDRMSVPVGAGWCRVCEAALASRDLSQAGYRPRGQRWSLRAWKLALGHTQREPGQSRPVQARTYDIVNCGPRTRFSANGLIVHNSLQYRTSARKLRSKARVDYDIPLEMPAAQRIHATYQRAYPGVPAYWEHQIALVKGLGYVETFGGNRIKVEGDWNGTWGWSMGSTAINARIQGTGADQKHLAIAVIKDYLRQIGGRFMFDLHDGLYLAIPKAIRPKAVDVMKQMLDNLPYQKAWGFSPPIPMPWDCKVGKAWGRLVEQKFA